MTNINVNQTEVGFEEESLRFTLRKGETTWEWTEKYVPHLEVEEGTINFKDALHISHEKVENGIGSGIRTLYKGFRVGEKEVPYTFETYVWIEKVTEHIYFEWIPICEEGLDVKAVYWPGEMAFEEASDKWYTLLNMQQGVMIPNTWETELGAISFDGFFGTAGGYMPWFAQVKYNEGYIAISTLR